MRTFALHDQLLAFTVKCGHIDYVKKVHCIDTYIEFAGDGLALPLAYIGTDGIDPMYLTFLDSFPDYIQKKIVHETDVSVTENTLIACTIANISGILMIRNIITEHESLIITAYEPTSQMYSLPYKDVGTLFKN